MECQWPGWLVAEFNLDAVLYLAGSLSRSWFELRRKSDVLVIFKKFAKFRLCENHMYNSCASQNFSAKSHRKISFPINILETNENAHEKYVAQCSTKLIFSRSFFLVFVNGDWCFFCKNAKKFLLFNWSINFRLLKLLFLRAALLFIFQVLYIHCKKRFAIFLSPAGMSLTKLSLAGNN